MGRWVCGGELFCWEFSIVSFTVRGRREAAEGWQLLYAAPVGWWEVVAVTCGCIADDRQPGRLIGLSYIIGHFTNILPALLLRHIVEGQHLSVRAIDPRVLQIKTGQQTHPHPPAPEQAGAKATSHTSAKVPPFARPPPGGARKLLLP